MAMRYARSLLTGIVAVGLVLPSPSAKPQVLFRTAQHDWVIVPAYVNGRGPFDFVVDTGTSSTLIDVNLAAELELKPVGRSLLTSFTGSEAVPLFLLGSLSVGAKSVAGLLALAKDMREVQGVDPRIRGILGLNFLLEFAFLLDYGLHQLELYDSFETPNFAAGTQVPIQVVSSRILIVTATQAAVSGSWSLALDSGTPKIAVFEDRIRESQDSPWSWDGKVRVVTNLSSLLAHTRTVRDLALANLRLRNLAVIVFPRNPGLQEGIEDGLLPAALFRRILVNAKQNYAILEVESSVLREHRKR
jgi:hypothetical protein